MRHRIAVTAAKVIVSISIVLGLCAGGVIRVHAADEPAKTETVSVAEGNTLEISVPKDWKYKKLDQGKILPPTVTLESPDGKTLLQLTLLADPNGQFANREEIEKGVKAASQQYVDGSAEKKVTLLKLDSKNGIGSYAPIHRCVARGESAAAGAISGRSNRYDGVRQNDRGVHAARRFVR